MKTQRLSDLAHVQIRRIPYLVISKSRVVRSYYRLMRPKSEVAHFGLVKDGSKSQSPNTARSSDENRIESTHLVQLPI
jgi:hypothetical protein